MTTGRNKVTFRLPDQEEPQEPQVVPLFHDARIESLYTLAFPTEQRMRSKKIEADMKARGE
eukprot:1530661-Heterocapsa_arctica.AAC.1